MHFSQRKVHQLRSMPITLRQSLLRIENAVSNHSAFTTFCALETEEGDGGHLGDRALTMDIHEWVDADECMSIHVRVCVCVNIYT